MAASEKSIESKQGEARKHELHQELRMCGHDSGLGCDLLVVKTRQSV